MAKERSTSEGKDRQAAGPHVDGQQGMPHQEMQHQGMARRASMLAETDPHMQQCIRDCQDCHDTCVQAIAHCLQMNGDHAAANHIRILTDCAEICKVSADFMIRKSEFHPRTCAVCSEVCHDCAVSCAYLAGRDGDEMMQICTDICNQCSKSCREMAKMGLA